MTTSKEDLSDSLYEVLSSLGAFPSEIEMQNQAEILERFDAMWAFWIKEEASRYKMPRNHFDKITGQIFTFGSYRFGVSRRDSDIDVLGVAPFYIRRKAFFGSFAERLKRMKEVTDLRKIWNAAVPIIKMKFNGIEIDFLFATLTQKIYPADLDLLDDRYLDNPDKKSIKSLNGVRTTDEVLRLVPNVQVFKKVLRTVTVWAKQRLVYGSQFCYPGGIGWAIMVARVCQMYPDDDHLQILYKFFKTIAAWKWPEPVLLRDLYEVKLKMCKFRNWDPVMDRENSMPVISPAYPQKNTTLNVKPKMLKKIVAELERGAEVVNEIYQGNHDWYKLFESPDFFKKHDSYLIIVLKCDTKKDCLEYRGLIESQMPTFIFKLEKQELLRLPDVNPHAIERESFEGRNLCCFWFIGLDKVHKKNQALDLREDSCSFLENIPQQAKFTNIFRENVEVEIRAIDREKLTPYLEESKQPQGQKRSSSGDHPNTKKHKRF